MNPAKPDQQPVNQPMTTDITWRGRQTSLNLPDSATLFSGPESLAAADVDRLVAGLVDGSAGQSGISISQLLAGDDRIAIPVTGDAARISLILEPLLAGLMQAGAVAENITLVAHQLQFAAIEEKHKPLGFQVVGHELGKEDQKAYLASTRAGTRLYLNRHLLDCDVIVPVIVAEPRGKGPSRGFMEALWPAFSDQETITKIDDRWNGERKKIRREIHETLWLGGFHLAIAAVPASGGLSEIVMAAPQSLQKMVMPTIRQKWTLSADAVEHARNFCFLPSGETESGVIGLSQLLKMLQTALKIERAERIVFSFELEESALDGLQLAMSHRRRRDRSLGATVIRCMERLGGRFKTYSLTNLPEELTDQAEWIALEEPRELENLLNR